MLLKSYPSAATRLACCPLRHRSKPEIPSNQRVPQPAPRAKKYPRPGHSDRG